MAAEHVELIGNDFASGLWLASCSCGWEARQQRQSQGEATEDWENHTDAAFVEATGG